MTTGTEEIGQSWVMSLMQAALAALLGLLGFIWRQLDKIRVESAEESRRLRTELSEATRKQDAQLQTTVERIRIDFALQNNIAREERKDMKAELRQDNQETKDEIRADMASMETRIMKALEYWARQPH